MDKQRLMWVLHSLNIPVTGESGEWLSFRCPVAPWKHKRGIDTRPSAGAKFGKNAHWNCLSCHSAGPISSLIEQLAIYRQEDYSEILDNIEALEASFLDYEDHDHKNMVYPNPLGPEYSDDLFPSVIKYREPSLYLKSRGFNSKHVADFDLRYDPEKRRIIFTIKDQSNLVFGIAGRSIDLEKNTDYGVKYKNYAGSTKDFFLYGEHKWDKPRPTIVVEGQLDAVRLYRYVQELQLNMNVGALMGSRMSEWQASKVIANFAPVYMFTDNDKAGRECIYGYDPDMVKSTDPKIKKDGEQAKNKAAKLDRGAYRLLKDHVPVMVPDWSKTTALDPDKLTKDEFLYMITNTALLTDAG